VVPSWEHLALGGRHFGAGQVGTRVGWATREQDGICMDIKSALGWLAS